MNFLPDWFRPKKKTQLSEAFSLFLKFFSLRIIQISLIVLLLLIVIPLVFFIIHRPTRQNDISYGVTFSNRYATELGLDWQDAYIKSLDDLQVKNYRLVAYWDDIERVRDTYDYTDIKWQLDEAEKRDTNIILAVGKKAPRWPECFEPDWWKNISHYDERELELLEFVKLTVNELKGYDSIKIWQVENEPFFPFGECSRFKETTLEKEINLVRSLDSRPILTQDSGEGGLWFKTYSYGDLMGISMYRKIWYDFWGVFLGRSIYFQYPLAHWSYKIKAAVLGIPYDRIYVTELQAEPWGPGINSELSQEEKNKTMSVGDFVSTISYAQNAGFKHLYFWGVEWWLWEKEVNGNSFYWDTARALFATGK